MIFKCSKCGHTYESSPDPQKIDLGDGQYIETSGGIDNMTCCGEWMDSMHNTSNLLSGN